MKIRDIIGQEKATLSFEVFPPKKDKDFASVEAAALGIAALRPSYMSVFPPVISSLLYICSWDNSCIPENFLILFHYINSTVI